MRDSARRFGERKTKERLETLRQETQERLEYIQHSKDGKLAEYWIRRGRVFTIHQPTDRRVPLVPPNPTQKLDVERALDYQNNPRFKT